MILDPPKYRAALAAMGPRRAQFVAPPPEFREWLEARGIPAELVAFLVENAVAEELPFQSGSGGMWTPADIISLNDQESAILAAGFLAVGNSTNGDFIVIDLTNDVDEVGFVSHDELWDPHAKSNSVREIYAPVDRSIDAMIAGMTAQDTEILRDQYLDFDFARIEYPIDYYSALELGPSDNRPARDS